MTKQVTTKIKRHINVKEAWGALLGMIIVLVLVIPAYSTFDHLYERYSPVDSWFEYQRITPFHNEYFRGDAIRFITVAEYKKELKVQWYDTLWCDTGSYHVRLQTQITPDQPTYKKADKVGIPDENGIYPTWQYTAAPIPEDAVACRLESVIVATTPRGYEKTLHFETQWFSVNK